MKSKVLFTLGAGLFSDSYGIRLSLLVHPSDLFISGIVSIVIEKEYPKELSNQGLMALFLAAALVGSVVGNLVMGYLVDSIGRRQSLIITAAITVTTTVASACLFLGNNPLLLISLLTLLRFFIGFGIGGEYPSSLTASFETDDSQDPDFQAATEAKSLSDRLHQSGLVFCGQGLGILAAALVVVILLGIVGTTSSDLDLIWRLSFLFGLIPISLALYFRWNMQEPLEFANCHTKVPLLAAISANRVDLVGTSLTWFLFNFAFYGQWMLMPIRIQDALSNHSVTTVASSTFFVALLVLPAYFASAFAIKHFDFHKMLLVGFGSVTLFSFLFAALFQAVSRSSFSLILFYGLLFIFFQPVNTATFVLPAEVFSVAVRGRLHGFSAACGKIGAALGVVALGSLTPSLALVVSAVVSLAGVVFVKLFVAPKNRKYSDVESWEE